MHAGVGDGALPLEQELVLPFQAVEGASLQGVVLDVSDAAFDLPFVGGAIGPCWQEDRAVMGRERTDLGVELGLEPVGFLDCGAKVVEDQAPGRAAEMIERILKTTNEVLGRLSRDRLAVRLAGVTQDDAKDVGLAPLAIGPRSGAPVPKSTWASSPGSDSKRRTGRSSRSRRPWTKRRTLK